MALGPLMIDVAGLTLTEEERDVLQHPLVGGVILFSRNYVSPDQLSSLVTSIRTLRDPHLLVAVDHEGGRVQRFKQGFTHLPPVAAFGKHYHMLPEKTRQDVELAGWLMAAELDTLGVDFSFAPVLDLDYGISEIIGDRSFHRDPHVVADLARVYTHGMKRAGMPAVGKHFPGHGAVAVDSHASLPVDLRDFPTIWQTDMLPFNCLCQTGLAGVMPAHIVYQQSDNLPAGFSPFWLKSILRDKMGFQGAILSDDLNMQGAAVIGGSAERVRAALSAGCDMVLLCNNRQGVIEVIDRLKYTHTPASRMRLTGLYGSSIMDHDALLASQIWQEAKEAVTSYVTDL